LLAATLDTGVDLGITGAKVSGALDNSAPILLAAWLRSELRVPVELALEGKSELGNIIRAEILTKSGAIVLERTEPGFARLEQPGQPDHAISLPLRGLGDCLTEELRRLDADIVFGRVLTEGLPLLVAESELI
jgi:glucose-6-phosphate dehydrogenase assembly protein OpcA